MASLRPLIRLVQFRSLRLFSETVASAEERKAAMKASLLRDLPAAPVRVDLSQVAINEAETTDPLFDSGVNGEYGGRRGPEPTRFGDWEKNGRCIDF